MQIQRLGWSVAEVQQFIAERFDGKRRTQLTDDELILLLYGLLETRGRRSPLIGKLHIHAIA